MKRRKWQTFVRPFFVYFNVHTRTPWHTLSKTELIELIDLVLHVINGWRMCIWRATYITLQRASERDTQNEVEIEGARDIPSPHSIWRSILLYGCMVCTVQGEIERMLHFAMAYRHSHTFTVYETHHRCTVNQNNPIKPAKVAHNHPDDIHNFGGIFIETGLKMRKITWDSQHCSIPTFSFNEKRNISRSIQSVIWLFASESWNSVTFCFGIFSKLVIFFVIIYS